jgi:hypothetical protein
MRGSVRVSVRDVPAVEDGTWLALLKHLRGPFHDLDLDWTTFGTPGYRKSKIRITILVDGDTPVDRQAAAREYLMELAARIFESENRDPNWSWSQISGLETATYEAG